MEVRSSFLIKPVIKALIDVVSPAVDPNNKLAVEQLQLSIAALKFADQVMPLEFRYDRFELERFLELAERLNASAQNVPAASAAVDALAHCVSTGKDVLKRASAEPGELVASNEALRSCIGALVSAVADVQGGGPTKEINAAVMDHAREQLLRERAWVRGQGWETAELPAIEKLISVPAGKTE